MSADSARLRITRGVVIHGGVGTLSIDALTQELRTAYEETLSQSLLAGHDVLARGGNSVDATIAAVQVMEDSPLFNAGRGSNFDERGVVTMDASIMDGATLNAGAVAGVTDVRSPVDLARVVMDRSEHLMLIGDGAEAFARDQGIERTDASFFHTDRRWADLLRAKERDTSRPNVLGDDAADGARSTSGVADTDPGTEPHADPDTGSATDAAAGKSGTVGAVALDEEGRLAAATSTGGMANKTWGRVGDTPIVGAGTYASARCAVSCTGWGEYFIRNAAAYDVHARMAHAHASLKDAVRGVVFDTLHAQVPGSGGMVALDAQGHVELCFNTRGMYRGWIDIDGTPHVGIYAGE